MRAVMFGAFAIIAIQVVVGPAAVTSRDSAALIGSDPSDRNSCSTPGVNGVNCGNYSNVCMASQYNKCDASNYGLATNVENCLTGKGGVTLCDPSCNAPANSDDSNSSCNPKPATTIPGN